MFKVGGCGEAFEFVGAKAATVSGVFTEEQGHRVTAGRKELSELGTKLAGREIGESAHLIERFERGTGGDDRVHSRQPKEG